VRLRGREGLASPKQTANLSGPVLGDECAAVAFWPAFFPMFFTVSASRESWTNELEKEFFIFIGGVTLTFYLYVSCAIWFVHYLVLRHLEIETSRTSQGLLTVFFLTD